MMEAGKYVKAPIYDEPETKTKKAMKNKRKLTEESEETNLLKKKTKLPHEEVLKTGPFSFQDKLKNNLLGSRFRFLNEQMYKSKGEEAFKLFKEDASAFESYHEGYRHQISQWPMNPLDRIINNLKRLYVILKDYLCKFIENFSFAGQKTM